MSDNRTTGQKLVEEYRDKFGYTIWDHFDDSFVHDFSHQVDLIVVEAITRERAFLQDCLIVAGLNDGCLPRLQIQSMSEWLNQPIEAHQSDLLAAQAEVTRLRGLFEQILAHPDDMAYDARFWRNFAREALKDPS